MSTKILAIDDEQDFLESLKTSLEAEDYEVLIAFDGEQGLIRAKANKPDLIICDINMPEKNGFEVLKEVRKDDSLRRTPFIMLTALDDLEKAKEAYEDKVDFYVTKPVDFFVLLKGIKTLLGLQQSKID